MTDIIRICAADSAENINWETVWSTVFTGISVVFLILALLIIFFILMGKIFQSIDKKSAEKAAAKIRAAVAEVQPSPAAAPEIVTANEADEDDEEIIAVISAAIAAYSSAEGKQYRIVGVKKRERTARSGWSAAGIAENTRGFIN